MIQTSPKRPDQIALGIAIILASVTGMAFADAVVKLVSADLTVWQVFATRSVFALSCLLILARLRDGGARSRTTKWVLFRSGLLVLTWLMFYASFPVLDLSVAAVAVYTNPIITALLSVVVLRQSVTGRQWIGVGLGFLGVAAILKPGGEDFSWMIVLPLLGAAFYSLAMILTRSKCQDESAVALAIGLHGGFLITGLVGMGVLALLDLDAEAQAAYPFLLGDWAAMSWREWGLMVFLGALSAAFFLGVARAYQIAPPQIIATFDYGYLVSAAVWGFIFFAEEPDALTVLGMILITLAGVLVASRSKA
jgi:drug/metabolite transporter (DMT)-like permease